MVRPVRGRFSSLQRYSTECLSSDIAETAAVRAGEGAMAPAAVQPPLVDGQCEDAAKNPSLGGLCNHRVS